MDPDSVYIVGFRSVGFDRIQSFKRAGSGFDGLIQIQFFLTDPVRIWIFQRDGSKPVFTRLSDPVPGSFNSDPQLWPIVLCVLFLTSYFSFVVKQKKLPSNDNKS